MSRLFLIFVAISKNPENVLCNSTKLVTLLILLWIQKPLCAIMKRETGSVKNGEKNVTFADMKCSPFVRQYGIIEIYQLKSLTKGGIFMPKGQPNKRYTPEFKIKVVETMHREKLSYRETARQFDIPN